MRNELLKPKWGTVWLMQFVTIRLRLKDEIIHSEILIAE